MGVYRQRLSPYWWIRVARVGQPPIRESTRVLIDAPTKEQRQQQRQLAETIYAARVSAVAREEHDLPAPPTDITFEAYSAWYETHVSAHKRGAVREREILKALRKMFGPRPLRTITKADVLEWRTARAAAIDEKRGRPVSANTINRELDVLKHLLASAVPRHLRASPIAKLPRLRTVQAETHVLTPAEERRILKRLEPADRALVIAALDTLMRLGDLLALRWAQDHGRYLTILNPKTGKSYQVPVSTRLRAALRALPRDPDQEYVFAHRRRAEKVRDWRGSVKQMLERACELGGVQYGRGQAGVTFHCLRHTGASRMIEAGVSLRVVQELGGWSSARQLTRYLHPTDRAQRAAVEAVGAVYRGYTSSKRKSTKITRQPQPPGGPLEELAEPNPAENRSIH